MAVDLTSRQAPDIEITPDDVFTAMSNPRRRYVLEYLKQCDGSVSLRELSEAVACHENGVDHPELTRQQRKRVYTALHQTHLPTMHSLGIVTYDRHRTTVALTDAARDLDVYLEIVPEGHFTWSQYYLLLAGLVGALALAVQQGVTPEWLTGLGVTWFSSVAFAGSALVHYLKSRRSRLGNDDPPF